MKKTKILALVSVCLIAIFCLVSCGGGAAKVDDANGTCGTSLKWSYTSSDKTLTVSGSGDMTDYKSSSEVPWYSARHAIETIKIESGVTSIGSYAFYNSSAAKAIEMADSVTRIGDFGFSLCQNLEKAELSASLTSVGKSAFEACSKLGVIRLPSSLTTLGDRAFALCSSLADVYILGNVDRIGAETFYNCVKLENLTLNKGIGADKVDADAFKQTGFTYEKASFAESLDATSTITILYVFENGESAVASYEFGNLALGEEYSRNTPAIEGYTADILTVRGVAEGKNETIKVTFKKNPEVTTQPEQTTTEAPDEEPAGNNYIAIIIMAVIIVGICVAAFFIVRAEKKENAKKQNQSKAKNRKKK